MTQETVPPSMRAALELSADMSADAIIAMHAAHFVPPHHERVPALMADLVEFARRTDIQLLVQSAIVHAQFETIHPFPDGNGRTLIAELRDVAQRWESDLPARRGSAGSRLPELLLRQPVVTTKIVATELDVTEVAAQAAINRLVDGGVLQQTNSGRRNRIWHAPEVLAALDRFAERARRRNEGINPHA